MDLDVVFFIGPQGSGKGTQAKILGQKLKFYNWDMGGILREVAKSGTELGNTVDGLLSRGILLNDELLLSVAKHKLSQLPKGQGIIFDGIPRRVGQAKFLLEYLKQRGQTNMQTLFISLPREESLNRLLLRAEKEKRTDDTREVIEFRLKQYEEDTLPVLAYLKQETKFAEIDGSPQIDEVTRQIDKILNLA